MINTVVVEEEEEEDCEEVVGNSKDLMRFLGMKDGVTASMASQGTLSDDCVRLSVNNPMAQFQKSSEPVATQVTPWLQIELLCDLNAGAWVSMVSYFKKFAPRLGWIGCAILQVNPKKDFFLSCMI